MDRNLIDVEDFFSEFFGGIFDLSDHEPAPLPPRRKKERIANEFGNKIGGSRRDMWAKFVTLDDLSEMNDAEKVVYVKKDTVWPKPDYEAMLREGRTRVAVYYIKHLRDSIAPSITRADKAQLYIEAVTKVKEKVLEYVFNEDDFIPFHEQFVLDSYFVMDLEKKVKRRYISPTEAFDVINCPKVLKALQITKIKAKQEADKNGFLMSEDEKLLRNVNYHIFSPDNIRTIYVDRYLKYIRYGAQGRYATIRNLDSGYIKEIRCESYKKQILCFNDRYIGLFDSEQEARDYILDELRPKTAIRPVAKSGERKKSFCYEKIESLEQSNYDGETHRTGEDYLKEFGFYGGEFGNWLSDKERQINLDRGYVAFQNLAKALGIKDTDVSLGEKLSIAFGARGKGNALAHFEPLRRVINLTKLKGAGSLAHEWGHALDHILSEKVCGFASSFMQLYDSGRTYLLKSRCPAAHELCMAMFFGEGYNRTEFYKNSEKMGKMFAKDNGYWDSAVEMFARAFACYTKDKLESMGLRDDYLCGHSECASAIDKEGNRFYAIPMGEERVRINAAFDKLIKELFKEAEEDVKTA